MFNRLIACILWGMVTVAGAQSPATTKATLSEKQKQLKTLDNKAKSTTTSHKKLKKKVSSLRLNMQKNAQISQQYEKKLLHVRDNIAELQQKRKVLDKTLQTLHSDLNVLLRTVHKIKNNTHVAIVMAPTKTKKTMLALSLLRAITPQVNAKLTHLKSTVKQLSALKQDLIASQNTLRKNQDALKKSRVTLHTEITQYNAKLHRDTKVLQDLQKRQDILRQEVNTLQSLLKRLQEQRQKHTTATPANMRKFPLPKNPITRPVQGKIIVTFNQKLKNGAVSDGIAIRTLANAQVIAPFDGYVAYAGTFKQSGKVIIISHERGYNTLLIGFDDIHVQQGDWILEKDPIGTTQDKNPILKIKIKYGTKAENPLLWIHS